MATLTSNRMCAPRSQGDLRVFFNTRSRKLFFHGDYSLCTHASRQLQISHAVTCKNALRRRRRLHLLEKAQQMEIWSKVCHLESGANGGVESQHVAKPFHNPASILCVTISSATPNRSQYAFCHSQHVNFQFFIAGTDSEMNFDMTTKNVYKTKQKYHSRFETPADHDLY